MADPIKPISKRGKTATTWTKETAPKSPGRPKGSRNKLGEEFISALAADFEKHGAVTIERVRQDDPSAYVKVVANLLPKEIEIKRPEDGLSDEELEQIVAELRGRVDALRGGAGPQESGEPASGLPAVH